MRFNELLGIMRGHLTAGERAYDTLFAVLSPAESKSLKHKDLQWKLAEQMDDLSVLAQAAGQMRFAMHDLEKAFEELYDIIITTPDLEE